MNAGDFLTKVREVNPLVHHLTNWVTIYDCANIVKVFGASPVMAHAVAEAADMASISAALVLNIGTLTDDIVESMKLAAAAANKKDIPVTLDVCGAGATKYRDEKIKEIVGAVKIDIIKGNASEIARTAGLDVETKGVDATQVDEDLVKIAQGLAERHECLVVITGKTDIIADVKNVFKVDNGAEMMACVVGTGCMAASIIGTFTAVAPNDLCRAAAAGLCCYGIAAEIASAEAKGPALFKQRLFDAVFALDADTVNRKQRITK